MSGFSHILNYTCPIFDKSVRTCVPKEPVISLAQDNYDVHKPTVEEGSIVKEGQLLGIGKPLSAGIHSPVPGKVKSIFYASMPDGKKALSVKIKLQGEFSFLGKKKTENQWKAFSTAQLGRIICDKGVVNTFGYTKSLALEIKNTFTQRLPFLAVRLFDEDPGYDTDGFIARNYLKKVLTGIEITARIMNVDGVIIVYSQSQRSLFDQFELLKKEDPNILSTSMVEWIQINTKHYPYGDSEKLIDSIRKNTKEDSFRTICNRDIFVDTTTVYSVYEAVVYDIPVFERFINISGSVLKNEGMFKVRIGTTINDIVNECGGFTKKPAKVIVNGLINGNSIISLDTPITKSVKAIRFLSSSEIPDQKQANCIRCGRCHASCPSHLHPERIFAEYRKDKQISNEQSLALGLCTFCSLCNIVCPSRLPLVQTIEMLYKENKLSKNSRYENV